MTKLNRLFKFLKLCRLGWVVTIIQLIRDEDPKAQSRAIFQQVLVPIFAILAFVGVWQISSARIETKLGAVPGPKEVKLAWDRLMEESDREKEKEAAFYQRQDERNARLLAKNPDAELQDRVYAGKDTYGDQIITSLQTVFAGFLVASLFAVPIGICCGLSKTINTALNPLIQIFKPVSPLAWLPIVWLVVGAFYTADGGMFEISFINSALTVALCSLWPTLVNTALGVASIDKDHLNVARVLKLNWWTKIWKIVLPSALPLIFAGLRLSLGVGWMVLIAAEMLAQNPGLGKFVWDMFQNGSSETLAMILVAVFTIGIIGFLLDSVMLMLQQLVSYEENV